MRFLTASTFTGTRPWAAEQLAVIDTATVRLHWTDAPYRWHVNDGVEVFVVLDGTVDMHYRSQGQERVERLVPGRICIAEIGDEHVAHPIDGPARILVVEQAGSE
ncbi:cupin [Janibacter sp. G1551]|uniref:cupin n=1 Tax=Janibacter sp. G1551 TaxID=3420440 RepID=UPI003CFDA8FB